MKLPVTQAELLDELAALEELDAALLDELLLKLETLDALLDDEVTFDEALLLADEVPVEAPGLAPVPPPPQATRKAASMETKIIPQDDR